MFCLTFSAVITLADLCPYLRSVDLSSCMNITNAAVERFVDLSTDRDECEDSRLHLVVGSKYLVVTLAREFRLYNRL